MEFDLTYKDATLQYVSPYAIVNPSFPIFIDIFDYETRKNIWKHILYLILFTVSHKLL